MEMISKDPNEPEAFLCDDCAEWTHSEELGYQDDDYLICKECAEKLSEFQAQSESMLLSAYYRSVL